MRVGWVLRAWLGPFPGPVARMGVDLIRSDPQVSNPFSPTQQAWSTSYLYNYEVSNATSSPVPTAAVVGHRPARPLCSCLPADVCTVGDGSICSRAAIRRQRGSGTEEAWVRRFWLGASQEPGPGIILHPGYTLISILRMHLGYTRWEKCCITSCTRQNLNRTELQVPNGTDLI